MTQVPFQLVCIAKKLEQRGDEQLTDLLSVSGQVLELVSSDVAAAEKLASSVEAVYTVLTDPEHAPQEHEDLEQIFDACVKLDPSIAPQSEGTSINMLLRAARGCAANSVFPDPATQRFWFASFGATAQDVPLQLFYEKFTSHFEEHFPSETAEFREQLLMNKCVSIPLRRVLVGNSTRLSKMALQDFLDGTTSYCLPDAIFAAATNFMTGQPSLCEDMGTICDECNVSDVVVVKRILRDNCCSFLEVSKLSTVRLEQVLIGYGMSKEDSKQISLGVYMRHRVSLSNEVVFRSKIEQALYDVTNRYVKIDLSGCQLSNLDEVKSALVSWPGIEELDLSGNNLHAAGVGAVVDIIAAQPNLRSLNLSGNNIQASGIRKIMTALSFHTAVRKVTTLTTLDVSVCHGTAEAAKILSEEVPHTTIANLSCGGNDFGTEGAAHLAQLLSSPHRLMQLSADSNHFGDQGVLHLAEALESDVYLNILSLANNDITNQGTVALHDALKKHQSLRSLDLSMNWITTKAAKELTSAISGRKGLALKIQGFPEGAAVPDFAGVSIVNQNNLTQALKDLSQKSLPMWSADEVQFWAQHKLGRLDLGLQLKKANVDGSKIRGYTMKDAAADGFVDNKEIQDFIFSLKELVVQHS